MLITKKNVIIIAILIMSVITLFYFTTGRSISISKDKNEGIDTIINYDSCKFNSYNTRAIDTFSLKIGSEHIYEAHESDSIKYKLNLTRIKNNKILCKFIRIVNDSIQLKSIDTVFSHADNTNSSHPGKYYYQYNGKLYETFNRNKDIHLIIDDNKANYVAYQIWNPNYLYNLPIFIRKGVDEPFHNYLMNLIDYNYAFESSKNKTLLHKELKKNYKDISNLLNQIDSNRYNYNYKLDQDLLDKTIYFGLDSLSNLLTSRGVVPRSFKPDNIVQNISSHELNNTSAIIRYNIKNKILNKRFECISKNNKNLIDSNLPIGFHLYNTNDNLYNIMDNHYLMLMHDNGFENTNYIITTWRKCNEFYTLEGIADTLLTVSIGGIVIDKILEINKNIFLIIGKSGGGDEGYVWGNVWFGKLTLPNSIKIIKEFNWSGNENRHEYVNYTLDSVKRIITIKKGVIIDNKSNKLDSSIYNGTLNYLNFSK